MRPDFVLCKKLMASLIALGLLAAKPKVVDQPTVNDPSLDKRYEKCLTGRCEMGNEEPGKMPHYSLGIAYTCDGRRNAAYLECRAKSGSIDACLKAADAVRAECAKAPCPYVYLDCIASRCNRKSNDDDCWREKKDGGLEFGYTDIDEQGAVVFTPLAGQSVPADVWQKVCERRKARCLTSLVAKDSATIIPINTNFCSAKYVGHNCHHAADHVCRCLQKEGVEGVGVIVLDDDLLSKEIPKGNTDHSLLTIPHPDPAQAKQGVRCLLESQYTCEQKAFDPNCCYRGEAALRDLPSTKCSLIEFGPLKEKFDLQHASLYDKCETFLRERGVTEAPGTHPTKNLRLQVPRDN